MQPSPLATVRRAKLSTQAARVRQLAKAIPWSQRKTKTTRIKELQVALESAHEEATRGLECCACMDSTVNAVLHPCGHLCLCVGCATHMQNDALRSGRSMRCPLCRIEVKCATRAFLPLGGVVASSDDEDSLLPQSDVGLLLSDGSRRQTEETEARLQLELATERSRREHLETEQRTLLGQASLLATELAGVREEAEELREEAEELRAREAQRERARRAAAAHTVCQHVGIVIGLCRWRRRAVQRARERARAALVVRRNMAIVIGLCRWRRRAVAASHERCALERLVDEEMEAFARQEAKLEAALAFACKEREIELAQITRMVEEEMLL